VLVCATGCEALPTVEVMEMEKCASTNALILEERRKCNET
jgi:hypothetical protein